MYSVKDLLESCYSVGGESEHGKEQQLGRKTTQKRLIKVKKCRGCREAKCIPPKTRSDATDQSEVTR